MTGVKDKASASETNNDSQSTQSKPTETSRRSFLEDWTPTDGEIDLPTNQRRIEEYVANKGGNKWVFPAEPGQGVSSKAMKTKPKARWNS